MEPVNGWIDNIIQKYIKDMLKDVSFDYKALLGHPKTKEAAQCLAVAVKASVTMPFDVDDKAIDMALAALIELLDQYKNEGPVKVGATPEPMERRSRKEVEEALRAVGIDPITIASFVMLILQYAPDLIAMIKKIFGK